MEYKYSVFIAYWGTEAVHGSYARALALKTDIEESTSLPLPYINSRGNDVLFTEHTKSTIEESKLFLLVVNSDIPRDDSGFLDKKRCGALRDEIARFIELVKLGKRSPKDFAFYFESNAVITTAQINFLTRLLGEVDPTSILSNGNTNFHLKSTHQIINWIEERWGGSCKLAKDKKIEQLKLSTFFNVSYIFSQSLLALPIPGNIDAKCLIDFTFAISNAREILETCGDDSGVNVFYSKVLNTLDSCDSYLKNIDDELYVNEHLKDLASGLVSIIDDLYGATHKTLTHTQLFHYKQGGYLGLLLKLTAINDDEDSLSNIYQIFIENVSFLKIADEAKQKVIEKLTAAFETNDENVIVNSIESIKNWVIIELDNYMN